MICMCVCSPEIVFTLFQLKNAFSLYNKLSPVEAKQAQIFRTILTKRTEMGRKKLRCPNFQTEEGFSCRRSPRVRDLGVTQRQIPLCLQRASQVHFLHCGRNGCFWKPPGETQQSDLMVLQWTDCRAGYWRSLLHPSASCTLLICQLYINKPQRPDSQANCMFAFCLFCPWNCSGLNS